MKIITYDDARHHGIPFCLSLAYFAMHLRVIKRCEILHIMSIHSVDKTDLQFTLPNKKGFINQVHSGNNPL